MKSKIIITYVYPPIPIRSFDWQAYYDGYEEGACGWGSTPKLALDDLLEQDDEV